MAGKNNWSPRRSCGPTRAWIRPAIAPRVNAQNGGTHERLCAWCSFLYLTDAGFNYPETQLGAVYYRGTQHTVAHTSTDPHIPSSANSESGTLQLTSLDSLKATIRVGIVGTSAEQTASHLPRPTCPKPVGRSAILNGCKLNHRVYDCFRVQQRPRPRLAVISNRPRPREPPLELTLQRHRAPL